jgi:hypothetical protein
MWSFFSPAAGLPNEQIALASITSAACKEDAKLGDLRVIDAKGVEFPGDASCGDKPISDAQSLLRYLAAHSDTGLPEGMMVVIMNKRGRRNLGELFDVSPEGGQDLKTFDSDSKKLDLKIGDEIAPAYKLTVVAPGATSPAPSVSTGTGTAGESESDPPGDPKKADEPGVGASAGESAPDLLLLAETDASSLSLRSAAGLDNRNEGDTSLADNGATGAAEGESGSEIPRSMEKMRIDLVPEANVPAAAYCVQRLESSSNPTETTAPEAGSEPAASEAEASRSGDVSEISSGSSSGSQAGQNANFAEASASLAAEAAAIGGDGEEALDDVQAGDFAAANPA